MRGETYLARLPAFTRNSPKPGALWPHGLPNCRTNTSITLIAMDSNSGSLNSMCNIGVIQTGLRSPCLHRMKRERSHTGRPLCWEEELGHTCSEDSAQDTCENGIGYTLESARNLSDCCEVRGPRFGINGGPLVHVWDVFVRINGHGELIRHL
jgi:hypothetical protein